MEIGRRVYRSSALKRLSDAAMAFYRRLILLRAADHTLRSERASCLVLAPHPDDETLGCGATVLRKLATGARVYIAIATDGRHSHASSRIMPEELAALRKREAAAACSLLGLPPDGCSFLDYADGALASNAASLARDIRGLVERFRPEEVLVPSAVDVHPDHRALNAATRRALAAVAAPIALYEYPVWFWDARSWVDRDAGRVAQALQALYRPLVALARCRPRTVAAAPYLARKRTALAAYKSQMSNLTGEPGWAVLDERFLRYFFQEQEIFFAVELER